MLAVANTQVSLVSAAYAWILLYSYTYTKCVYKVNKLVFKTQIWNLKRSRD